MHKAITAAMTRAYAYTAVLLTPFGFFNWPTILELLLVRPDPKSKFVITVTAVLSQTVTNE